MSRYLDQRKDAPRIEHEGGQQRSGAAFLTPLAKAELAKLPTPDVVLARAKEFAAEHEGTRNVVAPSN